MLRSFHRNTEKSYMRLYPDLTLDQIKYEIVKFEEDMIVNGTISETSSNETKYLRGWLARANHEAKKLKVAQ